MQGQNLNPAVPAPGLGRRHNGNRYGGGYSEAVLISWESGPGLSVHPPHTDQSSLKPTPLLISLNLLYGSPVPSEKAEL